VGVLGLDALLDRVVLAEHAVVVEGALLGARHREHHGHHVEAHGTAEVFGTLISEGCCLIWLINAQCHATIEVVYFFCEAIAAEGFLALGAVVHLVEDVVAGAGAQAVDRWREVGGKAIHLFLINLSEYFNQY